MRQKYSRYTLLAFVFAAALFALDYQAFAAAEGGRKDTAADSATARSTRLRRPTHEVKAPDEGSLLTVLPEFARDELLTFEEKLLEPRKAKRAANSAL